MALPYYRFFVGDYDRDTRHLSMMQHGAYRLLIDAYMVHGPLPNDLQRLARLCSAFSAEERSAIDYVLTEFFVLQEQFWTHKRCDAERFWQQYKSDTAVKSIEKRWKYERTNERNTNQNQNQNQNQKPEPKKSTPLAPSADALEAAVCLIPVLGGDYPVSQEIFNEFANLYPDVDIKQTLNEIRAWCISNPQRRKTQRGALRFINRWMEKEQNG